MMIETPITYTIDHMRLSAVDRVTSLIPLDSTERTFHGRHDKRLCFWLQPTCQSVASERFGEIFDQYGRVIQAKFLSVGSTMSDIVCQICHQFTAPTFDDFVAHVLRDHSRVITKQVPQDYFDSCHYHHLGFACGHNERPIVAFMNRFSGPLGRRLYHALLGEVLKCHCGLPFASIQHLAAHYGTCIVDPANANTTGPSLMAWYMHSFGINSKFHDLSVFLDKATWMLQEVSDPPRVSFSRLGMDENIAFCRTLKTPPTIVVVRDSGFGLVF